MRSIAASATGQTPESGLLSCNLIYEKTLGNATNLGFKNVEERTWIL
jgi:hypothetical protein